MAGSETVRISNEQMVMPSWLVASIRVACSMAHSVVLAALLPSRGSGLDLGPAGRDNCELGADEERVARQQDDQPDQTGQGLAHGAPVLRRLRRQIVRDELDTTDPGPIRAVHPEVPPATGTLSPVSGIRPSCAER